MMNIIEKMGFAVERMMNRLNSMGARLRRKAMLVTVLVAAFVAVGALASVLQPADAAPVGSLQGATAQSGAAPAVPTVTATFRSGESVIGTYELEQNAPLGFAIPSGPIKSGYFFLGWRAEEGASAYADAATVIREDTAFEAEFLAYEDALSVRFVRADEGGDTETVFCGYCLPGMPLGTSVDASGVPMKALPAAPAHETLVFGGWYRSSGGAVAAADRTMILQSNTVFTARYAEGRTLTLHDVGASGEQLGEQTLLVADGTTLGDALARVKTAWSDGTLPADCVWYSAENTASPLGAQYAVTADTEVYTYHHRLTLRPTAPQQGQAMLRSASVAVEGDTVTVECREGELLTAADFVVGDESLEDLAVYKWIKPDSTEITLDSLIGTSLAEPLTLTRGDLISSAGTSLIPHSGTRMTFYVFVDNERVNLGTRNVTTYSRSGDSNERHYVSAGLLESVYADYGFTADKLIENTRYFPHVDEGKNPIWADTAVLRVDSITFSPITNKGQKVDIYYLPKQTLGATSGNYNAHIADNTFYTVTIVDSDNQVYDEEISKYWLVGDEASVTVPCIDEYIWTCISDDGARIIDSVHSDIDNTDTFTTPAIDAPYTVYTREAGNKLINYSMSDLPEEPEDAVYGTPTIGHGSQYMLTVPEDAIYTVLAPSLDMYRFRHDKYLGEVVFKGWELGDTGTLLQPGDNIDLTEYPQHNLNLRATWEVKTGGDYDAASKNGSMINFFVYLAALPEGSTETIGSYETNKFTDSVYCSDCGVSGSDMLAQELYYAQQNLGERQYFVLGSTNAEDIYDAHDDLTTKLTGEEGYTKTGKDGKDYTFKAEFPSDEEVLVNVREMIKGGTRVEVNGHLLTPEEVTSDAFTVKWYVFKWAQSDGWHIDGYLIARQGKMRIMKNFSGAPDVIDEVKENFSITVAPGENTHTPVHQGAELTLANATVLSPTQYEWEVDTDLYYNYKVRENNYTYTGDLAEEYTTLAWYSIRDSISSEQQQDWTLYDGGDVNVMGLDFDDDNSILTVQFGNMYIPHDNVVLQKIDAASNTTMAGVDFTISKDDDTELALYDLGANHYSSDAASGGTPVGNAVSINSFGQAFLELPPGTYTLTEATPAGYEEPGKITFTVESSATEHGVAITYSRAQNNMKFVRHRNQFILEVRNYSKMVPLTVTKSWLDHENTPVTVRLYRNGVSMGHEYEVALNGLPYEDANDKETAAWQCTFPSVPLLYENAKAVYTVREESINGFYYSDEFKSGYSHYDVTSDGMVYYDIDGHETPSDAIDQVAEIGISVSNRRISYELSLLKRDEIGEPVDGARFKLFLVPALPTDTNVVWSNGVFFVDDVPRTTAAEGFSDGEGTINFGNMKQDMYYLVESVSPEGFRKNNTVYRVRLTDLGRIELERQVKTPEGDNWLPIEDNTIINKHITKSITVKKANNNGAFLPGAVFRLQLKGDGDVYENCGNDLVIAGEAGVTIENLVYGDYRLLEVTAPDGYHRLAESIEFSVGKNGTEYSGTAGIIAFNEDVDTFTVINHPEPDLPETGGFGAETLVSLGGIMMLASLALYRYLQRKRSVAEN